MEGIEISEVGNLQIIGGKVEFWWIMLGKIFTIWRKIKSLPNYIQGWILDGLRCKYEKGKTV